MKIDTSLRTPLLGVREKKEQPSGMLLVIAMTEKGRRVAGGDEKQITGSMRTSLIISQYHTPYPVTQKFVTCNYLA
jgi:hypothetical protein